jgi:lipoprotein NlpI
MELMPGSAQAYNTLSAAYLHTGNIQGCAEASLAVLELNAGYAPAHHNLAVALRMEGRLQEARAHFDKAVALGYPVDPETAADWSSLPIEGSA